MVNQQYDAVHPAITEVTSPHLSNLCMVFGAGSNTRMQALGFYVDRTVRRHERIQNPPTVPANDSLDFGKFVENGHTADPAVASAGTDLFSIQNNRETTIEEISLAVNNDGILAGAAVGDSEVTALDGTDRARGFGADDLVEYGGVRAELTRTTDTEADEYPVPTTALSPSVDQGLLRFDAEQAGNNPFYWGFYNTTGADVDLDAYAVGARYKVTVVENDSAVRRMLNGDAPCRVVQHGSFSLDNPNLPRAWAENTIAIRGGELLPTG